MAKKLNKLNEEILNRSDFMDHLYNDSMQLYIKAKIDTTHITKEFHNAFIRRGLYGDNRNTIIASYQSYIKSITEKRNTIIDLLIN